MRSFLRSARALPLAALALALLACWPALAGQPGSVEVTVDKPDGETTAPVLASGVTPDITTPYTVRQADRTTTQVQVEDGVSIRKLLEQSQTELGYGTLEIPGPNGRVVTLTRKQVDQASPPPPVLYSDESGATWFLRSPTGPDDVNAADHFQIASVLKIKQIEGELTVKVKASRKKIDPGESIDFTATVSGGPSDVQYVYKWNFDDGKRIADGSAKETHEFAKEGTFEVLASVTIVGETRSDSGVVRVEVGDPKQSDKDREGGGDNGAANAPDSGTSTGSTGGGSTYDDGSSTYTPYSPAPVTPPTPTPTPTPPTPSAEPPQVPDIATSGTPVEGNLLADVSDPPPSNLLESAARAARDGNPKDDAANGAGVSEAALSIAGVLALLGLGAGIENRQGRPLRLRLSRRGA